MDPEIALWLRRHKPAKCPDAFGMQTLDGQRRVRPMWRGGKAPLYVGANEKMTKAQARSYAAASLWGGRPSTPMPKTKRKIGRPPRIMPTVDKIVACHKAHPDWTCKQIGAHLNRGPAQVRRALARCGFKAAKDDRSRK